jgi:hypothetical protein
VIDTETLEQRSDEWRQARVGCVTASRVGDIVKTISNGKAYSAKRLNYFNELVAERVTGKPQDWKEIRSLNDRADLEPDARDCYTFYTGNEVRLAGLIKHPTILNAAASPDGLVKKTGGVEIKVLDSANHLKLFGDGPESVIYDYLPQVHFNMACTGRKWWDFVGFNPHMPEELKIFIQRVSRDDAVIEQLETAVKEFLAEVDAKVSKLLKGIECHSIK